MNKLYKIDLLSSKEKMSKIGRGLPNNIIRKNIENIIVIPPFYDDGLDYFFPQDVGLYETNQLETTQVLLKNIVVGSDIQNPKHKLEKIMGNTQAHLIENSKKDYLRFYEETNIVDLQKIPDWVKNDSTVSNLIDSGIGKLVYYGNLSKETVQSLKLKFDKGFIYFDGLKYICKRISCKKNIKDEIFEMHEEEFRKYGSDELNDFLKA